VFPPSAYFLPESSSRRTSQYEDIPDLPSFPHARLVACHNVFRWRTQLDRAGVLINLFSFGAISNISFTKTLLAMGFQRETASRGSLAGYTSVCISLFVLFHRKVTPVLACVCCFFRVLRFSYNTNPTFYCWGDRNYGRGGLCFRNIPHSISSWLVLTPHQLTKQTTTSTQPATDASFERGEPATSARDDDREAR
jgi:hypothetical protein